jgi:hypothetical protein
MPETTTPWPNQEPIPDGVTPVEQVDQSPDLFADDDYEDDPE